MDEDVEKIVLFLSDKLERTEKKLDFAGETIAKLIDDIKEIKLKTLNLHKRLSKFEEERIRAGS